MKKKPGPKPIKGESMTATERMRRYRAKMKATKAKQEIIKEEMEKVGVSPVGLYLPSIYLHALRQYEIGLCSHPDLVDAVAGSSRWLALAIRQFLEARVDEAHNPELSEMMNSAEWQEASSIDYGDAMTRAKIRIHEEMEGNQ
ncbi:hypothetical protein Q9L42_004645 [Methylomarinum sp. Ch1-1]|uniref:Uncharacterized protein n=1 Tax=Methylomarinum roseum TaxID=3067653 RepID=A0AAU7NWQ4_9GAMM|nr:hypothetical protein [Methylomarinum sp. Ch1-1]MDP4522513.1 hypothetical protein [Methylomarinum sp. Ch1-1]